MFYRSSFSALFLLCLFISIAIIVQGAKLNICDWMHCENGGTCQQRANSIINFKCRCQFGFSGLLCENPINITTCVKNPCKNYGNCSITNDRIAKCTCPESYTGDRCETINFE